MSLLYERGAQVAWQDVGRDRHERSRRGQCQARQRQQHEEAVRHAEERGPTAARGSGGGRQHRRCGLAGSVAVWALRHAQMHSQVLRSSQTASNGRHYHLAVHHLHEPWLPSVGLPYCRLDSWFCAKLPLTGNKHKHSAHSAGRLSRCWHSHPCSAQLSCRSSTQMHVAKTSSTCHLNTQASAVTFLPAR